MSSITVRQAVFSDLPSLAELFNQYRVFQGFLFNTKTVNHIGML